MLYIDLDGVMVDGKEYVVGSFDSESGYGRY